MNSAFADKLIVALDVATKKEALDLVAALSPDVGYFKIGLQLYTAEGPEILRAAPMTASKIFLDLKLHDIPNTVSKAVIAAGKLGVRMLTIHLSGGSEMIRAAVDGRESGMLVVGVTVLTSSSDATLCETGISGSIDDQVLRLAQLGVSAGIDGIVASPHEAKRLRIEFGDKIKIVTPGVRPSWSEPGDQKRFMTPREAIAAGADYLVIGRPITAAAEPRVALRNLLAEFLA
ncbi:MAG: orotidine-5'-phosphate decarboxylase [Verrucomicrobiota bacterium]